MKEHHNLKIVFSFTLVMEHKGVKEDEPPNYVEIHHTIKTIRIFNPDQIKNNIIEIIAQMKDWIPEFEMKETGQKQLMKAVNVNISKYETLRGGSYIELDEFSTNKKCCINI